MKEPTREQKIEQAAKDLAYIEVRVFHKELLIKVITDDETQALQELSKLEVLYTRRNELKKQLEDL